MTAASEQLTSTLGVFGRERNGCFRYVMDTPGLIFVLAADSPDVFGGIRWGFIAFERTEGWLAAYISASPVQPVRGWKADISYSITLLREDELGGPHVVHGEVILWDEANATGKPEFLEWPNIFDPSNGYLKNGCLTFEVQIKIRSVIGIVMPIVPIFDQATFGHTDICLLVDGSKYHVLKEILAVASDFFKALFSDNFAAADKNEFELKDVTRTEIKDLLTVIYAPEMLAARVQGGGRLEGLLRVADMYDVGCVLARCSEFLLESDGGLDAVSRLCLAVRYRLPTAIQIVSQLETLQQIKSVEEKMPEWKDFSVDVKDALLTRMFQLIQ